jgi:hypothetical protein
LKSNANIIHFETSREGTTIQRFSVSSSNSPIAHLNRNIIENETETGKSQRRNIRKKMSMSPEKAAPSATGFRSTVNTVRNEKKWVSPFRQSQNTPTAATTTESSPAAEKKAVQSPKPKEDGHTAAAVKKERETNGVPANGKKVIVEPIIDLGGGLKMPESKILAIAKEKLSKDLQTIDDKATEQKRLKELKHQKKLELEALKDQNKVNSRFAKFKRKLDFEKNKFSNDHQQKVTELEGAIASYDKQIADFDKKTHDEIDAHQKDHEEKSAAADEKLAKDKETTILDADTKEKEHLDTIHNHVISQKRAEISSRVLHAQRSEYELKLELLQLQLAQNEREVAKQQGVTGEHSAIKEDLETKVKDLQDAIAENDAAIAKSKESDSATEADLRASEEELEDSKARVEELKQKLIEVRAGAPDRATRLVDAKKKRHEYEEEQERLKLEEEERKKKEEEERKKREEEERIAKAKAAEEAKIAADKKAEEDRIAKEHAEEAAKVAALQKAREDEEAKTAKALADERVVEEATKRLEQDEIANTAVEKSAEPAENQSSKIPATAVASSAAAGTAIASSVAAATSAGPAETSSKLGTATAKAVSPSNETPKASNEEKKKRRVSGFFSVFKRKDKDADVEDESKATKSKSKSKAPLAAAGVVVAGATAVAATGAAIASSTAHKAADGTGNVVTSATGSLPVSKPAEIAQTTDAPTTAEALTPVLTPESEEARTSQVVKSAVVESATEPLELSGPTPPLDNVTDTELKPRIVEEGITPVVATASENLNISHNELTSQKANKDGDILAAVTGAVSADYVKPDSGVTTAALTGFPTPPSTAPQETNEGLPVPSGSENKEALSKDADSPNVAPQISASSGSTKELSSREVTPEPVAGTGKNAKKNAKKRAAKKKKKAAAAAILPASSTPAVAAGAIVGASAEDQPEPVQSKSFETQEDEKSSAVAPTEEEPKIGYVEPKPVEIPDDQKFFPVADVSPVSHAQELTKESTEPENHPSTSGSGDNGVLETAGLAAAIGAGVVATDADAGLSGKKDESFPTLDPKVAGRVEPASQPQVKNEVINHMPEKAAVAKTSSSSPTTEKKGFFKRFLSHPSKSSPSTSPNATPATNSGVPKAAATGGTTTTAAATSISTSKPTEGTSKSVATDFENDSLYSYREVIVEEEVEI